MIVYAATKQKFVDDACAIADIIEVGVASKLVGSRYIPLHVLMGQKIGQPRG